MTFYSGTLIAESLRAGSILEGVALHITKISRADVGIVDAGQPLTWTLLEFAVATDEAERLAAMLQELLNPVGGWYCDFHDDDEIFVVFHGRCFRYRRGDIASRAEAQTYGRCVGVPEPQLDWPT